MSVTWPTSLVLPRLKVRCITPTLISKSHSLRQQVRSRAVHQWEIEADYGNVERSEVQAILVAAMSARGRFDTIQFVHPAISNGRGDDSETAASGITTNAHVVGYHSTIATNSWTPSSGELATPMDFIKFSGSNKVYMIKTVTSISGGISTVTLTHPLMSAISIGETVSIYDIPFTMRLNMDDVFEFNVDTNDVYQTKFKMMEAI